MKRKEIRSSYDVWNGKDWEHFQSLPSLVCLLEQINPNRLEDYLVVERLHRGDEEIGIMEFDGDDFMTGVEIES